MTKRMLMDATHAEETRVVVLDGNRLEDFDVETSTKRQLKGNIYLAKVVRVEPSLQAAFVEYGGNRHGFLAFGEIHPDYYQIPVADRQRLIDMQAEEARREEEEEDRAAEEAAADADEAGGSPAAYDSSDEISHDEVSHDEVSHDEVPGPPVEAEEHTAAQPAEIRHEVIVAAGEWQEPAPEPETASTDAGAHAAMAPADDMIAEAPAPISAEIVEAPEPEQSYPLAETTEPAAEAEFPDEASERDEDSKSPVETVAEQPPPELIGGESDGGEEAHERRNPSRILRNYKIQEVIKRRQILLVQVVKEERGTKGAALTTYLSLAGRFCVLMPNSPRGGGISRKITSAADRRRLKDIMAELEIPQGMGLIVRTAGANRPKPEIKRDCEYLLRLWDDIREHTLKSVAPALIYEEASLIKRAIRDVYSRDIDEILVDGEDGWRAAHEFMRMLMPSHAKKVQLWRNGGQPLFAKYQVEAQLDSMLVPIVQLRSGGYLVINQAEALVAIDVNSGRSTRERGIEETALRTNLEAADEVARQLRLRDLAGLIVIDFIDMEARKHNLMVERRLKDALKNDRARIQVGSISHFGLMEMSRQRLRPSLAETSFIACPHCGGTGHVRSTESAALHVLRGIEDEGAKRRAAEIAVYVPTAVALYILNHKRERLHEIELRYGMRIMCLGDDTQMQYRIDRVRAQIAGEAPVIITQDVVPPVPVAAESETEDEEAVIEEDEEDEGEDTGDSPRAGDTETPEEAERRRRRRRRRRRGGGRRDDAEPLVAEQTVSPEPAASPEAGEIEVAETHVEGVPEPSEASAEDEQRARRRGRRGGRRRRPDAAEQAVPEIAELGADQPDLPPVYAGPTPANPFGVHAFDIFDVMERAEGTSSVELPRQEQAAPAAPEAETTPMLIETPVPEPRLEASAEAASPVELPQQEPPASSAPEAEATPVVIETPLLEPEPEARREENVLPISREEAPEPEAAPPAPANDAAPEPAIKPILIGSDEMPVVEKKRGWWRR